MYGLNKSSDAFKYNFNTFSRDTAVPCITGENALVGVGRYPASISPRISSSRPPAQKFQLLQPSKNPHIVSSTAIFLAEPFFDDA
jgi:hypothetical protein